MPPPKGFTEEQRIDYIRRIAPRGNAFNEKFRRKLVREVEKYIKKTI